MTNTSKKNRPRVPNLVQVKAISDITPELRRITFHSPAIQDYPDECPAAHIKIFLPQPGQQQPTLPTISDKGPLWPENAIKPIVRSYTVRYVRPHLGEIDIEFVLHGDHGPASRFAQQAQIGQTIGISYPGGPCLLTESRHNFLVGDNTALPAIASLLEAMPSHNEGHVFILINNEAAKIELIKPQNIQIHWYIGDSDSQTLKLIAEFKQITLPQKECYFWLAGENDLVIQLRNYLNYNREQIYAVPYWRKGLGEEQYHQQRHQVMDQD